MSSFGRPFSAIQFITHFPIRTLDDIGAITVRESFGCLSWSLASGSCEYISTVRGVKDYDIWSSDGQNRARRR